MGRGIFFWLNIKRQGDIQHMYQKRGRLTGGSYCAVSVAADGRGARRISDIYETKKKTVNIFLHFRFDFQNLLLLYLPDIITNQIN